MEELTASISVKALVQHTLMSGDIDDRYSGRSTALEGIRGHQQLQRARGQGYEAERRVAGTGRFAVCGDRVREGDDPGADERVVVVALNGRVDGVFADRSPVEMEEIKTLRGNPAMLPESHHKLHWGQLRIYAHLLLAEIDSDSIVLRLCYLNLDDGQEHTYETLASRASLHDFYIDTVARYCRQLVRLADWWALRDTTLGAPFPLGAFRPGQRALATTAWRTAIAGGEVVLQAPTGIGKTMGVLYPAVRALEGGHREKVFFLTAKTVGRQVAESALRDMQNVGMRLRSVTITAKEKVCFTGTACDPEVCQYARGYFDRRERAVREAFATDHLDREAIEQVARAHVVCPFELSLDAARAADVIICDYNYAFDPVVYLRRFFDADDSSPYVFLIDEVHNLVDRGREMFSAGLDKETFLEARRGAGPASRVGKLLMRANRWFLEFRKSLPDLAEQGIVTSGELPARFIARLRTFVSEAEEMLREGLDDDMQAALLPAYFDVVRFVKTAEAYDSATYVSIVEDRKPRFRARLFCVDPSPQLREGLARAAASVLFSATLFPKRYYERLLGVREDAQWYALASPFPSENLGVFLLPIQTTFRARARTASEVAGAIATFVRAKPGNHIVFFPSYAYLSLVAEHYAAESGEEVAHQTRHMDEEAREAWLARFQIGTRVTGFALMGGIFGEGIDLAGDRLVGVMVVGVGLPQPDVERDLTRDHFGEEGERFAYQYPGMQRVLQTAGRLIRTEADRGALCLVDARFTQPFYRELMPSSWAPKVVQPARFNEALYAFWRGATETSAASVASSAMTGRDAATAASGEGT